MIIGYFLNAILTFCYLFVETPLQLLILQIGLGIAVALATPTWDALYSKYAEKNHRGYIWGLANGEAKIMTGSALILGGLIVSTFSFSTLFLIMGIIQTLSAVVQLGIFKK